MVSLYGRLFTFRERPSRTPLEDFLTEALADLLNRMPALEMTEFVARFFMPRLPDAERAWRELVRACADEGLQWVTRPSINIRSATRYPDLMLYAGEATPLLIVENKIGSGIGEHETGQTDENGTGLQPDDASDAQAVGTIDQLATYGRWLGSQCQGPWPGAIAFLTHFTSPPPGFAMGDRRAYGVEWQRVCHWREIWGWLSRAPRPSIGDDPPAWQVLAAELADFLAEKKMNLEFAAFYDVSAAEVFIKSAARFDYTFRKIRESISRQWPGSVLSPTTRGHIEYNSDAAVLWDWAYLRPPHSPVTWKNWYVAWGIRFPELSGWWKDASPALPKTAHAFVTLGAEAEPRIPVSSREVCEKFGSSWSVVPEDCFIAGHPLCQFPGEAETLGDQMIKWITSKADEVKPVLPQLVQLAIGKPPS